MSAPALAHRYGLWVVGAVALVAAVALIAIGALPRGGPLAFRATGPIQVGWESFAATGGNVAVTLCNTTAHEVTGIQADVQGIDFTRAGSTSPSPGVIVTYPRQLSASRCIDIGLKKAPELGPGDHRGALVVTETGGSTIRRDFILAGPVTPPDL